MAKVSHPNVAAVYDVESADDRIALAMEYVDGETLSAWLRSGHAWPEVVARFIEASRGLHAVHEVGLAHRDFKPANVILGRDGRARVLDFGLARGAAAPGGAPPTLSDLRSDDGEGPMPMGGLTAMGRLTDGAAIMGTPPYMAPEQHRGMEADATCDQYAVCMSLWEALAGEHPYEEIVAAGTIMELAAAKLRGPPPIPRETAAPRRIFEALRRGLEVDPSERWPTIAALIEELERDPTRARRRWTRRAVAGLSVVALGAGLGVWQAGRAGPCDDPGQYIAEVWDDDRAERVLDALQATGAVNADATFERTRALLDDFAERWTAMHDDACRATHVQGVQSGRVLDLRMACLQRQRAAFAATIEVLEGADVDVVQRAVKLASELPSVLRCGDAATLLAEVPPPEDPAVASRIAAERERLAKVRALYHANQVGKAEQVLAQLQRVAAEVRYVPFQAEVAGAAGTLQRSQGHFDEAERSFRRGYELAVAAGDDRLATDAAGDLAYTLGDSLGNQDAGLAWSITALALSRRLEPGGALEAGALHMKASVLQAAGRHSEAIALFREALTMLESLDPVPRLRVASTLNNLSVSLADRGDYGASLEMEERVLAIREEMLSKEHPLVAQTHNNIGAVKIRMGQVEEAKAAFSRALEVRERLYGPEDHKVAESLHNLGNAASRVGDYKGSLRYYERALGIYRKYYGEQHLKVAMAMMGIGNVLKKQGKLRESAKMQRRSLEVREQVLGEDHPRVALAATNLANTLSELDEHEEAEQLYLRALAIRERVLDPDHIQLADSLNNFGAWLLDRGRAEEAEPRLQRALQIRAAKLGPRAEETALTHYNLGKLHLANGDLARAREHHEVALAVREERAPGSNSVAQSLRRLAAVEREAGELDQAAAHYERAIEIFDRTGHRKLAWAKFRYVEVLWDQGKRAAARAMAKETFDLPDDDGVHDKVRAWLAEH